MSEICVQANDFLNELFLKCKFDLHSEISDTDAEYLLMIEGKDTSLLLSEGAELLDAVQHIVTLAFGHDLHEGKRFICDADNYRATREAELKVMARHAAEQVRKTGMAFTFGPMNAVERRVIHLALADEKDVLTESVGEGSARRLKVILKK
jgi:spoIIIJ-associated protein